jgi:hypothetical protein
MSPNVRAFRNVLQSAGFTEEERLVRESLQNSVDAIGSEAAGPVRVRIEKRVLTGKAKSDLVAALGLDGEPLSRHALFNLPKGNAFEKLTQSRSPFSVVQVSDFNTKGLSGLWNGTSVNDHFGRLVVHFGNDDKADAANSSGGSFGFGKTVYAKASKIGIVVYYSTFKPSPETDGASVRLMGTGLFDKHTKGRTEYTGFAFFGERDPRAHDEALPFVDDAAHAIAAQCGLHVRKPDEYGTTILILDCDLDVEAMRSATEKFWWPRITRDELDVTFVHNGDEQSPRPKKNPLLIPFIECLNNLRAGIEQKPKSLLKTFNRMRIADDLHELGKLACLHLGEDHDLAHMVALIRKPGMVVNYRAVGSDAFEPCVGVFHADDEIDKVLTYSEPPSHDRWDNNADRLRNQFGTDGADAVSAIEKRIETTFKDFQRQQEPPPPPGGLLPKELSSLLGKFFGGKGTAPPRPEDGSKRPVAISLKESRISEDKVTFDKAAIEVTLPPDSNLESVRCRVSAHHEVLGDASHRLIGRSVVRLRNTKHRVLAKGRPASHVVVIKRGQTVRLSAFAKTDPSYFTRMRVTVEEELQDA